MTANSQIKLSIKILAEIVVKTEIRINLEYKKFANLR